VIPYESLSRLLDGELPPEEAARLQARIAAEPALAAAWEQMRALPNALGALPLLAPPPALFAARPAPTPAPAPAPTPAPAPALALAPKARLPYGRVALGLAAAAGLVVALLQPPAPARLTLHSGVQQIDGTVELVAGGYPIHIDGVARIKVEPPTSPARGGGAEESPMSRSHALSALAGAVVTIAVYEGTAILEGPEGPTTLQAGETQTLAAPQGDEGPAVARRSQERGPASDPVTLQAELSQLREENARLRTEAEIARGQLSTHEGQPQPWPADLSADYRPAAWEARVRAEVAKVPGVEVDRVDCEEFPCITVLKAAGGTPGDKRFEGLLESLAPRDSGNAVAAWASEQQGRDDTEPTQLFALVNIPGESMNPDVQLRTKHRVDQALEELAETPPSP
jgi:hypothetical protein